MKKLEKDINNVLGDNVEINAKNETYIINETRLQKQIVNYITKDKIRMLERICKVCIIKEPVISSFNCPVNKELTKLGGGK